MNSAVLQFIFGLALGLAIAVGGYRKAALTRSGALAAVIIGTLLFGLAGWAWGLLLVAFFVASSALSFYNPRRKAEIAAEKFDKGSQRDWAQVAANGGWAALLALLMWLRPAPWLFPALVGALATVTADTWATELGTLSQQPPRLVTTWRVVPPGTNGGVSPLGTMAALVGGLFIGTVAFLLVRGTGLLAAFDLPTLARLGGAAIPAWHPLWLLFVATLSGLVGSFVDSLLGATVQRVYHCPRCDSETERTLHRCGTATRPLRGWGWMDNDMVNFLASVAGSLTALWLALLLVG